MIRFLLVFLLQSIPVFSYSIVYTSDNVGMFYTFINVVAGIASVESGAIAGFTIDTGVSPPLLRSQLWPKLVDLLL